MSDDDRQGKLFPTPPSFGGKPTPAPVTYAGELFDPEASYRAPEGGLVADPKRLPHPCPHCERRFHWLMDLTDHLEAHERGDV